MSDQHKIPGAMVLVPRDTLKTMHSICIKEGYDENCIVQSAADILAASVKQTPTVDGDIPLVAWIAFDDGQKIIDWYVGALDSMNVGTELLDRAHVAPLQAEIERLASRVTMVEKYEDECLRLLRGAEQERDQLKARIAELETHDQEMNRLAVDADFEDTRKEALIKKLLGLLRQTLPVLRNAYGVDDLHCEVGRFTHCGHRFLDGECIDCGAMELVQIEDLG